MHKLEIKEKEEKDEIFYTSKYDRVFKSIFIKEHDHILMEYLLGDCFGEKVKIIKYLYPELGVSNVNGKAKKLDSIIELEGKMVILEVNTEGMAILERNLNYFMDFKGSSVRRGEDYDSDIEYVLINLSYNLGINDELKEDLYIRNYRNKIYHYKSLRIININMDRLYYEWYHLNKEEMEENYKYLLILNLGLDELKKLSKNDKIVKKYMEELAELNNNETFRYAVSADEDAKLIQKLLVKRAKEDGQHEGLIKRNIEIAKNLLSKNYNINEIIDITGLSKKEINKLANEK